jgi:sensor histidine kinase YesM
MKTVRMPFRSFRAKILVSFFICIILPVAALLYLFTISLGEVAWKEMRRGNDDALHQVAKSVDDWAERVLRASNLIVNDPEIGAFLSGDADWYTNYEALRHYGNIQQKLVNVRDILLGDHAIVAVLDERGFVHSTAAEPSDFSRQRALLAAAAREVWYERTRSLEGWPVWQFPYSGEMLRLAGSAEPFFALSRWIGGGGQSAALFIGLPVSVIPDPEDKPPGYESSHYLLADGEWNLLGGSSPLPSRETDELLDRLKRGESDRAAGFAGDTIRGYSVSSAPIPRLGWHVVQLVPQQQLREQLGGIRNTSILYLLGLSLLFAVVFVYFLFRFTRPLRELARSMSRLGEGIFDSRVPVRGEDEIAVLGRIYNKMIDRLREMIDRLREEQRRKEEARFQALQAQINPHFLYNTLNSIKWMATLSGADHVSRMITKLGLLLQYTMKVEREVVTLAEELTHLEAYLDLQRIRFHDNVDIRVSVPEPFLSNVMIKFTLQPIVENAIIHGNRTQLRIEIGAEAAGDALNITVSNNGEAISEDKLRELREQFSQNHARYSGIGIFNVHERIRMHFGSGYGIRMESRPEEGTVVTIRLPRRTPAEHEQTNERARENGRRSESDDTGSDRG